MIRFGSRLKGIWLLVSMVLFVTSIPNLSWVIAAPIETTTSINSSTGAIQSGEALNFSIYVYSGYDPIPTGSIRVIDTNTSQYINAMILGGVVIIEWTPDSFIEGVHIFKAEYQGYLDYSSSFDECVVYFDDYGSDPTRETAISLAANSTAVFKNKSIEFTVELLVLSQWYLNGGFIFIKNTNLNGSPVIHTHGPLPSYFPGTNPLRYSFSFDYKIPVFSTVGVNSFFVEYTGSSQSHTQPCVSSSVDISIISTGFYLEQNLDQVVLQRENSVLEITTTILGDYPVGLNLTHSYNISDEKIIFDNQIIVNRNVTTTFSPGSSIPTGPLSLLTELIDPSTSQVYTNSTNLVTIFDNARIGHTTNATEYKHNETIRFDVYITEEDVWTHPISFCEVELIDATDGNKTIEIKTANQDGFVSFEYKIPDNATVGNHEFCLSTLNAGLYINDISIIFSIPIKGLIDIEITYQSGGVDRNTYTPIEITVLSGGIVVNEGLVALEFSSNGTAIETKNCQAGLVFDYYISPSHPLGIISYQIHFYNSDNYDEHTEIFDLTIFSNPELISIGQNSTEVIKGQTLRIWGQLIDENNDPITFEEVNLKDTTNGLLLGTATTDESGIFYFDYFITESIQIGLHFIEIDYKGNIFRFFHESANTPVISVTVRPPLSVIISTEVISNSWTTMYLEGGLFDEIFLSWQIEGESQWNSISSVFINSTGQGEYNWSTPYYKGEFSIRAVGPNSTKYDYSTMYAIPSLSLSGDELGNVNEIYSFTINSTERYQIWIEGQIWQNWYGAGIHSYEYTFTSRGMKEIKVINNDTYVYFNEYNNEVSVYEDIIISFYSPLEAYVNITVNLDGVVIGEVSGPLDGVDIILEVNETEIAVDSTNGAGYYDFSIIFDKPGYFSILVRTPQFEFYSSSFSDESIIFIHSIPAEVEIISPLNSTCGSIVEIEISGDAEVYMYRIEPIDTVNISWTSKSYRTLEEGNYTCFVYGLNAFGIITEKYSNFIVDTTAPSLALVSPRNKTYTTDEVILSYLTDENNVEAFLDEVQLSSSESGQLLSGLEEGEHNLTVTAKDEVGNNITARALFFVDTILPNLDILSPFNQSYTGEITIKLNSNGTTILYNIQPDVHTFNMTYASQIAFNLSIGNYILNTYAYDDAGNFLKKSIEFSIVQTIDLLLNPSLELIDNAGNYRVKTQVISHPNFDSVGFRINGTLSGILDWSSLYSDYRSEFQLDSPGNWQLTLYAKTTNEEYDFHYYNISWNPPAPIFDKIVVNRVSSYYKVQVTLLTESLNLEFVKMVVNGISYNLTYEYFGDRWTVNLPISPQNTTLFFSAWYPWDESPSSQKEYDIHWIAPSIITNSYTTTRENFTIEVTIEKQNASINSNSINLILDNGSLQINVSGILVYESLSASYQEWTFSSPNLPRNVWNFTLSVRDIYGINRSIHGIFNATDSPPSFTGSSVNEKAQHDDRVLYRVEIAVDDDHMVDRVFLYIDGIPVQSYSQNNTHFIFEVYMIEGVHTLRVVAFDDINQQNTLILESIEVIIQENNSTTSTTEENNTNISSSETLSENSVPSTGGNDIIELGLAGGILGILVALGNVITRIKKT